MEEKMTFQGILSNGFTIGLKNVVSLILIFLLWIVTIWIPYLNVGTTIALASLPLSLSRGKMISPMEIFDAKYRKYMGEFFVHSGLKSMALFPAFLFMIVPGIIISLSWCLSLLLLIDKGISPADALTESNKLTYGHKWVIFFVYLVLILPLIILPMITPVLNFIYLFFFVPMVLGCNAHIYASLVK